MIPNPWHKDVRLLESRIRVLARQGLMPTAIADVLLIPQSTFATRLKNHPNLIQAWRQEAAIFFAERFRTLDVLAWADSSDQDAVERVQRYATLTLLGGMDHTARRGYQANWMKLVPSEAMDRVMIGLEQEARGSVRSTWAELAISARETMRTREEEPDAPTA